MKTLGVRNDRVVHRVRDAAYVVIFDEDQRVACVAEESGLFLPGGGLEPGEDAVRAVHREVAEECGRALELIAPLPSAIQFFVTLRGEPYELHASFFLGRFAGLLDAPGQHALSWLPAAPASPPFYHECHRWAVQQALLMHRATDLQGRIAAARQCGVVRVELGDRHALSASADPVALADALATSRGWRELGRDWRELTLAEAAEVLPAVLRRDLAYGTELIDATTATAFATEFLGEFAPTARFLTNGGLAAAAARPVYDGTAAWTPHTNATFDTGVVAVDDRLVGIAWVEDED